MLVSQQDRRVWHRAAASLGPDDNIAQELDRAADEADRRGAMALVIAARERASELSEDAGGRAHRLLQAAEVAYGLGEVPLGNRLARSVEPEALEEEERSRCRWLLEIHDDQWSVRTTASVPVAEIVGRMCADGQGDLAWQWLLKVAITYWWDNPAESARTAVVAAAADAGLPVNESTRLAVLAHADPVRCGPGVVERIAAMAPDGLDPVDAFRLGAAANAAWAYEEALPFLSASTSGLRSQGRMGLLAEALAAQAWAAVHLAREPLAVSAAEEAVRLGRETGQPRCVASAQLAQASIAAERGEMEVAEAIIAEAEALLAPIGATSMLALVQFVRGRGAVAHQRYAEGLDHLQRVLDPADPLLQPFVGAWGLSDLVEAAAHSGRHDLAEDYLAQLEQLAATTSAPFLTATAGYARAMVASDDVAEAAYQAAIEGDLANWPCYRGRMLLWYGRWLRRQRRTVESRTPLRAARQAFDVLAFPRLAEAARLELRASGEVSRRRVSGGWDRLTPQELQIARLAATGLTNREIGDRLYLSHRTVGYHLHRVFPKLGITSRNQLDPVVLDAVEELA